MVGLDLSKGCCIKPWDYTLGKWFKMVQNNPEIPKWGHFPAGVISGRNTKTLRISDRDSSRST